MRNYKDLLALKKALALAMKIFEISKRFPKEETYSLIDQTRRSSKVTLSKILKNTCKTLVTAIAGWRLLTADY